MRTVERVLRTQARARNWCDEYEQVVDQRLNPRLSMSLDSSRDGDAETMRVTWSERYVFTVERTEDLDASRYDEDEARDFAREADYPGDEWIIEQIRSTVTPECAEVVDVSVEIVVD